MGLRISFKPGMRQSQHAARYFHETVEGLVEAMMEGLTEHAYLIHGEEGPALRLRVWSAKPLNEQGLHALFEWLLVLRADVDSMHAGPDGGEALAPVVTNWLSPHLDGAQLFAELSIAAPDPGLADRPEFALGMVRGRCVLLSTDTLMFSWLEGGMFGLSLAGRGSYLLELVEGEDQLPRQWRKAS